MYAIRRIGVAATISCEDAEYRTVDGSLGLRTNVSYMAGSIGIIDGLAEDLGGAETRGSTGSIVLLYKGGGNTSECGREINDDRNAEVVGCKRSFSTWEDTLGSSFSELGV